MKVFHIIPVCLVSLGCCFAQMPVDRWQAWLPGSDIDQIPDNRATTSLARLRHKIPGKALAAFSRSLKLARHQEWQQGAKELETAVAIDPEFSDAHENLGVHYLMAQRMNEAVAELRRAIALDPVMSLYHSNLALAYVMQKRTSEAQTEAETAVSLDGRNPRGRYLLGLLLARNPAYRADAEKHLKVAADEMPDAHLALVKLYRAGGDESSASREMERYQRAISSFKRSY